MSNYRIGKLKDFIYLVEDLKYIESDYRITITDYSHIFKINANLVTLNETESFKGRFRFTTTVTCILKRLISDNLFISKLFKIVVEDLKGIQYLVSPEFNAMFTSETLADVDDTTHKLTFTTLSNIPTKILKANIDANSSISCAYDALGIKELYVKEGDKEYSRINYLSCQYDRVYDGNKTVVSIKYSIPVDNNHFNMLLFKNNRWDTKIKIGKGTYYNIDLFPQYIRQTSEEYGNPDIITITLSGIVPSTIHRNNIEVPLYRWIDTNSFICDGFIKYIKLVKQEFKNGEWRSTNQYRKGKLIELNSQDCGYTPTLLYRWVTLPIDKGYVCFKGDKYYKEVLLISSNQGETWEDSGIYKRGFLYEENAADCR